MFIATSLFLIGHSNDLEALKSILLESGISNDHFINDSGLMYLNTQGTTLRATKEELGNRYPGEEDDCYNLYYQDILIAITRQKKPSRLKMEVNLSELNRLPESLLGDKGDDLLHQLNNIIFLDIDQTIYDPFSNTEHQNRIRSGAIETIKSCEDVESKIPKYILNTLGNYHISAALGFPKESMKNLKNLCEKFHAKIVMSTSWRTDLSVEQLKALFSLHDLSQYIIDSTPRNDPKEYGRGMEIKKWLSLHPNEVQSFVILDDEIIKGFDSNYVRFSNGRLLSDEKLYQQAVSILSKSVQLDCSSEKEIISEIKNPIIDTPSKLLIDEAWLNSLSKKIEENYPQQYPFCEPHYPKEDIKWAYIKNTEKNKLYHHYNPFQLRLSFYLEGYEHFYDHTQIVDEERCYYGLSKSHASITYFNFLKQYNLAFITLLKAINGSSEAIKEVKLLFTTDMMFTNANVELSYLNKNIDRPIFILALYAYITLDIVFSSEKNISTEARIKALEFVEKNFDLPQVANAFKEYKLGYELYEKELVYDLVPCRFFINGNLLNKPHNELFLQNPLIMQLFQINLNKPVQQINLEQGVLGLLKKYPGELAQVLQSLLKIDDPCRIHPEKVFCFLVNLSMMDVGIKEKIFGNKASYRNSGKNLDDPNLEEISKDVQKTNSYKNESSGKSIQSLHRKLSMFDNLKHTMIKISESSGIYIFDFRKGINKKYLNHKNWKEVYQDEFTFNNGTLSFNENFINKTKYRNLKNLLTSKLSIKKLICFQNLGENKFGSKIYFTDGRTAEIEFSQPSKDVVVFKIENSIFLMIPKSPTGKLVLYDVPSCLFEKDVNVAGYVDVKQTKIHSYLFHYKNKFTSLLNLSDQEEKKETSLDNN